jgi:hypothetical protein
VPRRRHWIRDFHISIARTMALSQGDYNYPVMLNQAHAGRLSVKATDCIDPGVFLTHRLDTIYISNHIPRRPSWSFKKQGRDHAWGGRLWHLASEHRASATSMQSSVRPSEAQPIQQSARCMPAWGGRNRSAKKSCSSPGYHHLGRKVIYIIA